jgi:hypothetical protein
MNIEAETDDLDTFEKEFFGTATPEEKPAEAVKEEEVSGEDTPKLENDGSETPDEASEDNKSDDEKREERPKNRAQERITELARRNKELAEELEKFKTAAPKVEDKEKAVPAVVRPTPDDKDADGNEKYPLGEFDPQFILDLAGYAVETKTAAKDAEAQAKAKEQEALAARVELDTKWANQLETVPEKYEDYFEKTAELESAFRDLDPNYGEYLATTIMGMDAGVDVLYYLSENIDEAVRITSLGPVGATIALGKIEARFDKTEDNKKAPRLTKAPDPAPANKGSAATSQARPDTDDLDAFEKQFYKK